jgi:hypothetical protein
MNRRRGLVIAAVLISLPTCGSDSMRIDIDLAVNQSGNPLEDVNDLMQAGQSAGIFFEFQKMVCPPGSIDNTDNSVDPIVVNPASSPLQQSYPVSGAGLEPLTYYRVWMVARDLSNHITHIGGPDCPFNLALGTANNVTLCFGPGTDPALLLCPESLDFPACQTSAQYCR